jgi:ATP-dependent DNA helicase RecQ
MSNTPREILKQYWGFDEFRPLQEDIIHAVLNNKDTLALLPTGGGKSICYQVPALMKDGLCIVVSPLVALMKDQVENLKKKGINALLIHSGMKYPELLKTLKNAAYGNYKFLYLSPERIRTQLFLEYLPAMNISLLAVDEAHCISQWGYDFRPSYLEIAKLREELPKVPALALTASATTFVQQDICEKLHFRDQLIFRQSFARKNLSYSVFKVADKINKLLEILRNVKGSSLVYCSSRKKTKEIAGLLKMNGINADFYHAGLSNDERNEKQDAWVHNKIQCMVCTNAFGMGIDKPDVRVVVHYDCPDCLENYYQEAGRAGRDQKKAYAVLLYNKEDKHTLEQLPQTRFPSMETIRKVYAALANYLQVPADYGEDLFFDFDLQEFVKRFKLGLQEAVYSIKALEQEGYLQLNEQVFIPSTVSFSCDKESLSQFEALHPETEIVIKGLLRTYQGIFDNAVNISEKHLAGLLKIKANELRDSLKKLHAYGIIVYNESKERPQLQFLVNRVRSEDLFIKQEAYKKRKGLLEKRVNNMLAYLDVTTGCRTRFICAYFGDDKAADCGICDLCIYEKNGHLKPEEFDVIGKSILEKIGAKGAKPELLFNELKSIGKRKLEKVIRFLISEDVIVMDEERQVLKKKKG